VTYIKKEQKTVKNSVSIASVMEGICQEAERDTPLQSSTAASLPASAGNNSRGLQNQSNADIYKTKNQSKSWSQSLVVGI